MRLGWALSFPPSSQISLLCSPQWRIQDWIWGHYLDAWSFLSQQLIIRSAAPTHPFLQLQVLLFPLPTDLTHPNPWNFIFHFVCVTLGSSWGDVWNGRNPCALAAPAAPTLRWGVPAAKTQPLEFCLAWTSKLRLLPGIVYYEGGRWEKSKSVLLFHHFAVIKISVQAQIPFVHYIPKPTLASNNNCSSQSGLKFQFYAVA